MTTAVSPCLISDLLVKSPATVPYKRSNVPFLFMWLCFCVRKVWPCLYTWRPYTAEAIHSLMCVYCIDPWLLDLPTLQTLLLTFYCTVLYFWPYVCHSDLTAFDSLSGLLVHPLRCLHVFVCQKGRHALHPQHYHTIPRSSLWCSTLFVYTPVCRAALL